MWSWGRWHAVIVIIKRRGPGGDIKVPRPGRKCWSRLAGYLRSDVTSRQSIGLFTIFSHSCDRRMNRRRIKSNNHGLRSAVLFNM
jgi:hypothetical protein